MAFPFSSNQTRGNAKHSKLMTVPAGPSRIPLGSTCGTPRGEKCCKNPGSWNPWESFGSDGEDERRPNDETGSNGGRVGARAPPKETDAGLETFRRRPPGIVCFLWALWGELGAR